MDSADYAWRWVVPIVFLMCLSAVGWSFRYWQKHKASDEDFSDTFGVVATMWCTGIAAPEERARQRWLAVWRLLVFLYMASIQIAVYFVLPFRIVYTFFTMWNYHWQIVYFGVAAAASFLHLRGRGGPGPTLRAAMQVLFHVALPMSILVSIVLWCVLMPEALSRGAGSEVFTFFSYNQHALNTVFLLVEFGVSRMVVPMHRMVFMLVWASTYCVFVWIQFIFTHFWPYFFLELTPAGLFWYPMILALHAGLFAAVALLSARKRRRLRASEGLVTSNGGCTAAAVSAAGR
eukprot:TRINITY_DN54855_c0_g1_i1.p1 TRINITY_DN54855_c0_g1~~TRINITY_DN54855_c0_g1_i1.p1  ORF type:complete len:290 (+),score=44.64 TRINITY_DN54855_c0_g1_i1:55-924(+)